MLPIRDSVRRRHLPIAVWALIAANIVVFFYLLWLPDRVADTLIRVLGLVPARFTYPHGGLGPMPEAADYMVFVTNLFLHGSWLHLLVNLWTLWLFGAAVEDRLGPGRFLLFYFGCGIAANVVHLAVHPYSTIPVIGASGAVSGILGAYSLLFPLARIVFVIPIFFIPLFFQLPAVLYTLLWFILQFLQGTQALATSSGGVAWWAHIGGFVAGVTLIMPVLQLGRRRRRR